MRTTGFSGTDLNIPDYVDERCHEYTIMISTAVGQATNPMLAATIGEVPITNACVVLDDGSILQEEFAKRLNDRSQATVSWICQTVTLHQIMELGNLNRNQSAWIWAGWPTRASLQQVPLSTPGSVTRKICCRSSKPSLGGDGENE